jgi:hypothetical protein
LCHLQQSISAVTGATLGYIEIEPNFMDMVGSKVTNPKFFELAEENLGKSRA